MIGGASSSQETTPTSTAAHNMDLITGAYDNVKAELKIDTNNSDAELPDLLNEALFLPFDSLELDEQLEGVAADSKAGGPSIKSRVKSLFGLASHVTAAAVTGWIAQLAAPLLLLNSLLLPVLPLVLCCACLSVCCFSAACNRSTTHCTVVTVLGPILCTAVTVLGQTSKFVP